MKTARRLVSFVLAALLMMTVFTACGSSGESGSDGKKLTIMMYVVGSNLESNDSAATIDFDEIKQSGLNVDDVNFLIFTGGSRVWHSDISNDKNYTFLVTKENGVNTLKEIDVAEGPKNMSDPSTLSDFLKYAEANYPAKKYGLICWDHGGGPNVGFGHDEITGDILDMSEIKQALDNSPFNGSTKKLDWIGFDACLMGSIEVGDILKPYADYLIASEEYEPGNGWDYGFLSMLEGDYETESLAEKIVDSYFESYKSEELFFEDPPVTLSCVNLNKIDAVNNSVDSMFSAMSRDIANGYLEQLVRVRQPLPSFRVRPEPGKGYDLIDLGQMADAYDMDYTNEAKAVKEALSDYVVCNKNGLGAFGASIYYPYDGYYTFLDEAKNTYTNYTSSPSYNDYIGKFTDVLYRNVIPYSDYFFRNTSELDGLSAGDNTVKVELTDDQKKNFAKAYVNVLRRGGDEGDQGYYYSPVMTEYEVETNSDGEIEFNANLSVPMGYSEGNSAVWPMRQTVRAQDKAVYQSLGSWVYASYYDGRNNGSTAQEKIVVNAQVKDDESDMMLMSINYDTEQKYKGKDSVDKNEWSTYYNLNVCKYPARNDDGVLLPFSDWTEQGPLTQTALAYEYPPVIKMTPLSSCPEDKYYYQVVIENIDGSQYSSELIEFTMGKKKRIVTEKTAGGTLTYDVYTDHAEVKQYKGSDSQLTIPDTYNKLPVTKISSHAFDYESEIDELIIKGKDTALDDSFMSGAKIKKVTLPDGMKEIGNAAFMNSHIESVSLPDSLERIGVCAFRGCDSLATLVLPAGIKKIGDGAFAFANIKEGVSFSGENDSYKVENGFLLSNDGKTLYARFDYSENCTVPDGVEEIARWACTSPEDMGVSSVKLPDTLKTIRSDAFRDHRLKDIAIPDSVEFIAHNAFANYGVSDVEAVKTFSVGKSVRYIGTEVFGRYTPETVTVSKDNPYFSAKDGKLMNKAEDAEISLASAE